MNKKIIICSIILISILTIGVGVMGCGKTLQENVEAVTGVSSISVSPEETTLAPNGVQQFRATLYDSSNNVVTDESVTINWNVSGDVGTITQSGTFTATAIGDGQVIASMNTTQDIANISVVDGTPPTDFQLTIVGEKMFSSRTFTINWTTPEAITNSLVKYDVYADTIVDGRETDEISWVYLKKNINISEISTEIAVPYDGTYDIKVRVSDSKGLWRDSDGGSASGDIGDSSRVLRAKIDAIPPLGFFVSNINTSITNTDGIFRGTYLDDPKGPIIWNSAQDDNFDRYEITICTDPNDISGTSVFSKTIETNITSCEIDLSTGFYYLDIVAFDKAGHYRTLAGKTDIPAYDTDISSTWVYSLPVFGINGSVLNFVSKWGNEGSGEAQFEEPHGITADKNGYLYVVDSGNNRIQKFDNDGNLIAAWGSFGTGTGQFSSTPRWIAVDDGSYNDVYVTDIDGNVYVFHNNGSFVMKWTTATTGESAGVIWGITVDDNTNIYVTDATNHNVKKFSYGGTLLAKWGSEGTGNGQFNFPVGIAVDSNGNVFVTDSELDRIQKFDSSGSYVSKWSTKFIIEEGSRPYGIDIDNNGNIWVADGSVIKKFDSNGNLKLKWGHYGMTGPDDNLYFYYTQDIAVDNSGNIFFTEDQRDRILKFKE